MRIPLSRIYRAFPELDRYSDEQCERFLRSAARTPWRVVRRAFLAILYAVLTTGCIFAFAGLFALAEKLLRRTFREAEPVLAAVPALFLTALLPAIVVFLVRDRLLIRRVRHVLRVRGHCPACRYSLVGLPVAPDNLITCPECGLESQVDPSLSELTIDGSGGRRLTPGIIAPRPSFWTPRRKRTAKRLAVAAAVLVFVAGPIGWGGYELFLARQAARARAERPGVAGLLALVEANQPAGTAPDDPDAWDAFRYASMRLAIIDESLHREEPLYSADGRLITPEFGLLFGDWRTSTQADDPEDALYLAACEAEAVRHLEAYERDGLFEDLAEIARRPRAVLGMNAVPGDPLFDVLLPELGESRSFARLAAARMRRAGARGDAPAFADAFETALALARINRQQPFPIQSLVGCAIESLALAEARALLSDAPPADALDMLESALRRQRTALPADYHLQGDRLMVLDGIGWFFAEPSRVRFGRFSAAKAPLFRGDYSFDTPIGTYAANRRAVEAHFAAARAAALSPQQQPGAAFAPVPDLALLDLLLSNHGALSITLTKAECDRRALAVLIALERHRLVYGEYPGQLADLAAPLSAEQRTDPWSGQPFVYRRLDTPGSTSSPPLILYSIGPDGIDDGGAVHPDGNEYAVRFDGGGFDYLLSPPPREDDQ